MFHSHHINLSPLYICFNFVEHHLKFWFRNKSPAKYYRRNFASVVYVFKRIGLKQLCGSLANGNTAAETQLPFSLVKLK